MARLDVYDSPAKARAGLVVDIQTDMLAHLKTRVVIPMLPKRLFRSVASELNPVIPVNGEDYVLLPQAVATVPAERLGVSRASLAAQHDVVVRAVDVLLGGI